MVGIFVSFSATFFILKILQRSRFLLFAAHSSSLPKIFFSINLTISPPTYKYYLWTFFDTKTGKSFAVLTYYQEAESDEMKFETFGHHPSYCKKIDEDIMQWLNENLSIWEESRPDWFTADAVIAKIPADMLPVSVLQEMGGKDGRQKVLMQ